MVYNGDVESLRRDLDKIGQNLSKSLYQKEDIPDAADLNNYTTTGLYHCSSTNYAVRGKNYPEGHAGLLEVVSVSGTSTFVYQRYTAYGTYRNVYERAYYNGTWYPWNKLWSNGNDGAGSGLDADLLDGRSIWGAGTPSEGIPFITSAGVMEVSRYIDFHHSNTATTDYDARLHTDGTNAGQLYINGSKVWHANNDGTGSGLDADLLDGQHASAFLLLSNYIESSTYDNHRGRVKFKNHVRVEWGRIVITPYANQPSPYAVSFDSSFTNVPSIVVVAESGAPETAFKEVTISSKTASGFEIMVYRTNSVSTGINWIAVGR